MIIRSLSVIPLALALSCSASAGTGTFTNSSGIRINSGVAPATASPYPSELKVHGLTGLITSMSVELDGFSHTSPMDVDILLVAPDCRRAIILSDAGGSDDVSDINIILRDDASSGVPFFNLVSGTYLPTNIFPAETFPAPAPDPGNAVMLSTFNGMPAEGIWKLYVIDDQNGEVGRIDGWSLSFVTADVAEPGELVISEFRVRGPGGGNDEFVEIRNSSSSDHTVETADGSSGYAVVASDGTTRFVISNGTVIPRNGHFLGVNSVGYSLSNYPAGNGFSAVGDTSFYNNIPDNAGLALFRTSNSANFNLTNRLDAVGPTSEANTLYREGAGYPELIAYSIDYSFFRIPLAAGGVMDTGDNASDFQFVDTNGTSAGAGQRLGAPGPENLNSPIRHGTGAPLVRRLVDPAKDSYLPPNRVRNFTSDPPNNSLFGTLSLRRKFVNSTGTNLTRLRFRVVDLSTFPAPNNVADLRPRTSSNVVESLTAGGSTTVYGATLEQPPFQPNGGGFNSTLSPTVVNGGAPLVNGASIDVHFLFGIQQSGTYKLALVPETLPASTAGIWVISGHTDNPGADLEAPPAAAIIRVTRLTSNVEILHHCPTGILYQLQRSLDLGGWMDLGPPVPGTGLLQSYTHAAGASPPSQFYRLKEVR